MFPASRKETCEKKDIYACKKGVVRYIGETAESKGT